MAGSIRRRPDGKWRARYRDTTGREHARHFARKVDAERWLASVQVSITRGEWVDPSLARITFEEWASTWLASKRRLKAKTRLYYASGLKTHVLPRWGPVRLAAITHGDVVEWVAELSDTAGESVVRQSLDVLSQALSLAVRDGRLARNVAAGVSRPRRERGRQRFLSHAEVARLVEHCAPPYDVIVKFLAYTGLRFGEMAALRVQDVDLVRRRVRVETNLVEINGQLVRGTPKTRLSIRSVPFPRLLAGDLAVLVEGRDTAAPLFTTVKGSVLRNSNFRHHAFDEAVAAAGLAPLTPHDLRDTAASLAIAAGASVKTVQRMLGHSSAAMTLDVYAGLFDDELDGVADRMDRAARESERVTGTDENEAVADQVRTERPETDDADAED